jgi:hypothetical protein
MDPAHSSSIFMSLSAPLLKPYRRSELHMSDVNSVNIISRFVTALSKASTDPVREQVIQLLEINENLYEIHFY